MNQYVPQPETLAFWPSLAVVAVVLIGFQLGRHLYRRYRGRPNHGRINWREEWRRKNTRNRS